MRGTLLFLNRRKRSIQNHLLVRQRLLLVGMLFFLLAMVWLTFETPAQAAPFDHTQATVNTDCTHVAFSNDGNPFPLCPGPAPTGGNCVWWGWEQWHLLGYNLPVGWGNATDWIVDAERFGLSIGTAPRVGALAVFPVGDGVWAQGSAGHVAFVTVVSPDNSTFNVTYQNYGSTIPMYIGHGFNVSSINQPQFQNGHLRFIYFPKQIDPKLFAKLPGIDSNTLADVNTANAQQNASTVDNSRVALGLPPGSFDQEFNADFAGTGFTNLLLYNREQGRLDALALTYPFAKNDWRTQRDARLTDPNALKQPYRVSLSDAQTSATGWGQNLDIHIGDFTGSGHAEILLYDRVSGKIQLLTLNPDLTIAKHVTFNGWGPGWELYTGRFDGQSTNLFLYKRFAIPPPPPPVVTPPPGSDNPPPTDTPPPTTTPPPTATPTPTPSPTATPTPTPRPSPTATPTPTPTPKPSPTATPTPTPTATQSAQSANSSTFAGQASVAPVQLAGYEQPGHMNVTTTGSGEPTDTSGQAPTDWATGGLTAEIRLVSFAQDFTVGTTRDYTFWHNSWEVYIGPLVNTNRDGIFLYDRNVGEARLLEYTPQLQLAQFQFLHNLGGNWEVHMGDFTGQGQAQILLYDPSGGSAQMLVLKNDLSVANQVTYDSWGTNLVLYVGHFGLPTLSVMLYNPQQAQSTFLAFDASATVMHQYIVPSWGANAQILVGSFLDRAACLKQHSCASGDDILVLDRTSGMVTQYTFSFGNQFKVFDSRSQAFLREGIAPAENVLPVDASRFSLLTSVNGTIHDEELY